MKKTDIAMIVLIASMSILVAFFITRAVMGETAKEEAQVLTIEEIDPKLGDINPAIFNSEAINPAVEVQLVPGKQ